MPQETEIYQAKNKIRIVTAASLFDGHDAAINIMRRILQSSGAEIIHLGHDRSVDEIVNCAIQEDAQAIAITSYQGGHNEFFKYMHDLLAEKGCGHIKLFGGGGGVILPEEIKDLMDYGITKIYSPDDGRELGLQGMINDLLRKSDFSTIQPELNGEVKTIENKVAKDIATLITAVENKADYANELLDVLEKKADNSNTPVLGITGTGGAGKSTSVDEFVRRYLDAFPNKTLAIVSVDPTKRKSGGALLGDRIRMNSINSPRVFMRSLATREANLSMSKSITDVLTILKAAKYDLIVLESSGIGQSGSEIIDYSDVSMYVMTPDYGAASQLEKIDMLDFADIIALNKFDKRGGLDSLRDVKKQYQRNHLLWETDPADMPVFGTVASQFGDSGTNNLFYATMKLLSVKTDAEFSLEEIAQIEDNAKTFIIPPKRVRYLSEIAESNREYDKWVKEQAALAQKLYAFDVTLKTLGNSTPLNPPSRGEVKGGDSLKSDHQSFRVGKNKDESEYNKSFNRGSLKQARQDLRNNPTKEEEILWLYLKGRQVDNYKFRRQHSIEGYIVDFYNVEKGLVIELDGGYHNNPKQKELDVERDKFLKSFGLTVLRFSNEEVSENPNDVVEKIQSTLSNLPIIHEGLSREADKPEEDVALELLHQKYTELKTELDAEVWKAIDGWEAKVDTYKQPQYIFKVRDKEIRIDTHSESLSKNQIPKISLPTYKAWGDLTKWIFQENVPGEFPFTAGVYPFKRTGEDPTRMFAGEGGPERTNKRFHYVSLESPAKRLSTAFDSVTLYGQDPDHRPDIYGKVGNAGVSIWSLDAMKKLYSGFELTSPMTSVSMTINGPAATIMAFFLNTAIDQECEKYISKHGLEAEVKAKIKAIYADKDLDIPTYQGDLPEGNNGLGLMLLGVTGDQVLPADVYQDIKVRTISQVRGTVQADILKEDQAQNTCIFSTDFSLKLMGDVQQYFIDENVRNFYSVSISGYHIAEAGANPITQLAFTLANGFTYVEYYLSRGMDINKFAPNLSFFFSNGVDPEYAVIGRVARRIWAKAMRNKYNANQRSQLLKYHIQTSGRSLHAQEIQFNDIRTTLQALYAIYDNCNSLHTNAYDEAITTPTEESVRRAMAIQLIINKELGLTKNENPIQGSFIIEELTNLVEEAVLTEFDRITERGGVLGAMETMYQRGKIQEESMYYEWKKHTGEMPIIGVNTFLGSDGSPTTIANEVIRSTEEEKEYQITAMNAMQTLHKEKAETELQELKEIAKHNGNIFEKLMESVKYCTLGQITNSLFEVGGKYRRNM